MPSTKERSIFNGIYMRWVMGIGGFNALELGCGSGVAVVTALAVADEILHNTH